MARRYWIGARWPPTASTLGRWGLNECSGRGRGRKLRSEEPRLGDMSLPPGRLDRAPKSLAEEGANTGSRPGPSPASPSGENVGRQKEDRSPWTPSSRRQTRWANRTRLRARSAVRRPRARLRGCGGSLSVKPWRGRSQSGTPPRSPSAPSVCPHTLLINSGDTATAEDVGKAHPISRACLHIRTLKSFCISKGLKLIISI